MALTNQIIDQKWFITGVVDFLSFEFQLVAIRKLWTLSVKIKDRLLVPFIVESN